MEGRRLASNVDNVEADDYPHLVPLAKEHEINLVVPGPEAPLVDGIEDYFRAVGIRCYGPSKLAARLEGSKAFSKDFMKRHGIPTATYRNFSNYSHALRYLDEIDYRVVIKASGLAAGKGVIIPATKQEARDALDLIMVKKEFGPSGDEVVIEEFLEREELSILGFCCLLHRTIKGYSTAIGGQIQVAWVVMLLQRSRLALGWMRLNA